MDLKLLIKYPFLQYYDINGLIEEYINMNYNKYIMHIIYNKIIDRKFYNFETISYKYYDIIFNILYNNMNDKKHKFDIKFLILLINSEFNIRETVIRYLYLEYIYNIPIIDGILNYLLILYKIYNKPRINFYVLNYSISFDLDLLLLYTSYYYYCKKNIYLIYESSYLYLLHENKSYLNDDNKYKLTKIISPMRFEFIRLCLKV